jgi:hypothetical protein
MSLRLGVESVCSLAPEGRPIAVEAILMKVICLRRKFLDVDGRALPMMAMQEQSL